MNTVQYGMAERLRPTFSTSRYPGLLISNLVFSSKVTRGISDHGVFPVTQMKAVLCYESLSFRAQLQCCAGSDNT